MFGLNFHRLHKKELKLFFAPLTFKLQRVSEGFSLEIR